MCTIWFALPSRRCVYGFFSMNDMDCNVLASDSDSQLRKIIRAVRSSPQRRQTWIHCVHAAAEKSASDSPPDEMLMSVDRDEAPCIAAQDKPEAAKLLILDVKTRWSSTHQMLSQYSSIQLLAPLTLTGPCTLSNRACSRVHRGHPTVRWASAGGCKARTTLRC